MRIGIPNILALIGFCFAFGMGFCIPYFFIKDLNWEELKFVDYALSAFLILPSAIVTVVFCYKYKLMILFTNRIYFLYPFRFKTLSMPIDTIKNIRWGIKIAYRMGDYRTLEIISDHPKSITISDIEFSNFNQIEAHLLSSIKFEPNINEQKTIQISQARSNRTLNYIAILVISIFLLFFLSNFNESNNLQIVFISLIFLLLFRLATRIRIYNSWLKKFSSVRKKRLKNLETKN